MAWQKGAVFPLKSCDDGVMAKIRQLRDVYRFPGFDPLATVHGIFGDSHAVVVTLRRREKKRRAAHASKCRRRSTIKGLVRYETFPVAINASTSPSSFVGLIAHGVAP